MSLIYWDTMLFVYLIEAHPVHGTRTKEIYTKMSDRGDSLCTSIFTLGEVLVGPYKHRAEELITRVRGVLRPPAVELLPFTPEVAQRYARVRAEHRVSPADAIHLATASVARWFLFLTNDLRLSKVIIPGIDFIAGLDVNLF